MAKAAYQLTPIEQAQALILAQANCALPVEPCALHKAYGRILSEDIYAPVNVPPTANSAMDGYAFRYQDKHAGILPISQRIATGQVPQALKPGTCARIFTGAEIPAGADTVVMQEETQRHHLKQPPNDEALTDIGIEFIGDHKCGDFVRPCGQDVTKDSLVLAKGSVLSPRHMGVLASIGIAQVNVYRRLKVAIISTGSELQEPGQTLDSGKIYNSNRYQMAGLLQQLGMECLDFGIVADDRQATQNLLASASAEADVIITSGGVSVGEEDHVKTCVEALGSLAVWKLAIKPGKPLAFGHVQGVPFFGLPGNPASVLVTFMVIARPYLMALQGMLANEPIQQQVRLINPPTKESKRQEYLRVRIIGQDHGQWLAEAMHNQNSGILSAAMYADGLAVIPIGAYGDSAHKVDYLPFNQTYS